MPKKSHRGRALLFPSRPHFDGVAGEAIRLIGSGPEPCQDPWAVRPRHGDRWHADKAAVRARRRRQRQARRRS
jgi:hypothetical protein